MHAGILYRWKISTFSHTWRFIKFSSCYYGYNTSKNKLIVYNVVYTYIAIYRYFRERTSNRLRVRRFAICSAGPINQNKHAEPNRIITYIHIYTQTHTCDILVCKRGRPPSMVWLGVCLTDLVITSPQCSV